MTERGVAWLGAVLGEILVRGAGMAEESGVGSCLRRNDGSGCGRVGALGRGLVRRIVAFHPPPNLPPSRGEG